MSFYLRIKSMPCLGVGMNKLTVYASRQICSSSVRPSLERFRLRPSEGRIKTLMNKDNVGPGYDLIYRAPMENHVSVSNAVSTVSATIIAILAGYKMAYDAEFIFPVRKLDLAGLVSHESDIWYFAAGFVLINLAVRVFVAKYPLRIYKSPENYLAIYDSQIPFITTKHFFRQGEVGPVRNFLNPWKDSMYRLGNRSSLLLLDYFRTPSEFHQMCAAPRNIE